MKFLEKLLDKVKVRKNVYSLLFGGLEKSLAEEEVNVKEFGPNKNINDRSDDKVKARSKYNKFVKDHYSKLLNMKTEKPKLEYLKNLYIKIQSDGFAWSISMDEFVNKMYNDIEFFNDFVEASTVEEDEDSNLLNLEFEFNKLLANTNQKVESDKAIEKIVDDMCVFLKEQNLSKDEEDAFVKRIFEKIDEKAAETLPREEESVKIENNIKERRKRALKNMVLD